MPKHRVIYSYFPHNAEETKIQELKVTKQGKMFCVRRGLVDTWSSTIKELCKFIIAGKTPKEAIEQRIKIQETIIRNESETLEIAKRDLENYK